MRALFLGISIFVVYTVYSGLDRLHINLAAAAAQPSQIQYVISVTGIPTGPCTKNQIAVQLDAQSNLYLWPCINGAWAQEGTASASPTGVTSVFGRTGVVTATNGDYSTSLIPEGTNLYFTAARARSAVSVTAPLTYNSATGALAVTASSTPGPNTIVMTDANGVVNAAGFKSGTPATFSTLGTYKFPQIVACSDCAVSTPCTQSTGATPGAYAFIQADGTANCPF